jgi:hypothetical protein
MVIGCSSKCCAKEMRGVESLVGPMTGVGQSPSMTAPGQIWVPGFTTRSPENCQLMTGHSFRPQRSSQLNSASIRGLSSSAFVNDADIALSPSSAPSQANQALDEDPIRGCMIEPTRVTTLSTDDESPANPTGPSAA